MNDGCRLHQPMEQEKLVGSFLFMCKLTKGPHITAFMMLKLVKKVELSKWVKW